LVTAKLLGFQFYPSLVCAFRESDACLVVVAVFKTVAPTLRVGG
jgi:hypothetical protein